MSEYYVKFKQLESIVQLEKLSSVMNLEQKVGPASIPYIFFKAQYPCDCSQEKFTYLVYSALNDEFDNLNNLVKDLEESNEDEFRRFMTAPGYCPFGNVS